MDGYRIGCCSKSLNHIALKRKIFPNHQQIREAVLLNRMFLYPVNQISLRGHLRWPMMVYIPWKRQQNKWCSLFINQAAEIDGSRTKMKITQEWSIPTDPLMFTQGHLFKERLIHRIQNCCWFCLFSLINGHVAMKKIQLESTNICSYIADEWGPRLYQNPTAKKTS